MVKIIEVTLKNVLLSELSLRRSRNTLYSMRAFARDLNLGVGSLSEVLSGKRELSKSNLLKVLQNIELPPDLKNGLLKKDTIKSPASEDVHRLLLDDQFRLISDWYYIAILNLAKLRINKADPKWIAKRLNIELYQAIEALERLQRLGLLKIAKQRLVRTAQPLTTSSNLPSTAIRKHHTQNLQLAEKSLNRDPVNIREFASVTMPVNLKNLPKLKALLLKTRKKAADLLEDSHATEVYTLSFQLFPLTAIKGAK